VLQQRIFEFNAENGRPSSDKVKYNYINTISQKKNSEKICQMVCKRKFVEYLALND